MVPVEIKAASDTGFKLRCLGASADGLQCAEVVAGVKIVIPLLGGQLSVSPRAISVLASR